MLLSCFAGEEVDCSALLCTQRYEIPSICERRREPTMNATTIIASGTGMTGPLHQQAIDKGLDAQSGYAHTEGSRRAAAAMRLGPVVPCPTL